MEQSGVCNMFRRDSRGGSRKPLTIITKSSTLDVAAVLDPPLGRNELVGVFFLLE